MAIAGRSYAVTGAGGFIGGAICGRLSAGGAEVGGVDGDPALESRVTATGARFAAADITDPASITAALERAEVVIHTAAYVREWGEMEEFIPVNVGGTVNVLDAAEAVGAERVVHISSVVVYGYDAGGELDESAHRRAV